MIIHLSERGIIIRLNKIRVSVHPLTFPVLWAAWVFFPFPAGSLWYGIAVSSAVLFHEGAHLLMMARFRVPVREVRITPFGIVITGDFSRCSYASEALIHSAGGCTNLLCAALCAGCGYPTAAGIHLLLGLYNLMPLAGFDGGRMLLALLLLLPGGERYANRVSGIVSGICYAVLYTISGGVFWAGMHAGEGSYLSGALFFAVAAAWTTEMLRAGVFTDAGSGKIRKTPVPIQTENGGTAFL